MEIFGPLISLQIDNAPEDLVATLRKAGFNHFTKGKACDDFTLTIADPETGDSVAAVADGVSRSPDSRFGARVAVQTCVLEMADRALRGAALDRNGVEMAFSLAADEAAYLSQRLAGNFKSCSTTLLATARTRNDRTMTLNIGDGHILYYDPRRNLESSLWVPFQKTDGGDLSEATATTIHIHLKQSPYQVVADKTSVPICLALTV